MDIRETIGNELQQIGQREQVRILYAVESGSRAWGFASPDSDYDVRFIYLRPKNEYLRLDRHRDVIERPIDEVLDISGWDLMKALQLLYRSNPSLFEWMASPIVYQQTPFADRLRPLMSCYFSPQKSLHHYCSMAFRNNAKASRIDTIKPKQYFYILRPLLACHYVLETGRPAPMLFRELLDFGLPAGLRPTVEELLRLKMNAPENVRISHIPTLEQWIQTELETFRQTKLPVRHSSGWEPLNRFFLQELELSFSS